MSRWLGNVYEKWWSGAAIMRRPVITSAASTTSPSWQHSRNRSGLSSAKSAAPSHRGAAAASCRRQRPAPRQGARRLWGDPTSSHSWQYFSSKAALATAKRLPASRAKVVHRRQAWRPARQRVQVQQSPQLPAEQRETRRPRPADFARSGQRPVAPMPLLLVRWQGG